MQSINEFYRGQEVFVTGATGFIGKVLVEKLLRSCTEVKTIYLLMRSKKGSTPDERIKKLTDDFFFSKVKKENPESLKKLRVIVGDSKDLKLGMSDSDYEKVKLCSIIFHLAASVRFDDPLKQAILLNTRGAREICRLSRQMPNLKVCVHVSTAFVQPLILNVIEELIETDCDWRTYIDFAEKLPVKTLDYLTLKLTKYAPNTYTFTKLLAEHVCNDYKNDFDLPIVIYRPSIVAWSDSEIVPGWSDTLNGINSMSAAYLSGIKRVYDDGQFEADIIPVDLCVMGMIMASKKHQKGSEGSKKIPVYNASSIHQFDLEVLRKLQESTKDHPYERTIGIPSATVTNCETFGLILWFFYQIVPALLIDMILKTLGKKPQVMKLQRILVHSERTLRHFMYNHFTFDTQKFLSLADNLHEDDKKKFWLVPQTPITEYLRQSHFVSKEIVLNETKECEARALKRLPFWKALTWFSKALLFFLIYKTSFYIFEILKKSVLGL